MKKKRFEYRKDSQSIIDTLTGFLYDGNQKTCDLMNEQEEKYLQEYYYSKKVKNILQKYEIDDLNKLDRCLFEQRIW